MATIEDRARLIRESMLGQAKKEASAIREKADAFRKEELARLEDQVLAQIYKKIKSDVAALQNATIREVAQYELEQRRRSLGRREELAALVFAAVRSKLLDYANTEEYRAALLEDIGEHADEFEGCRIGVREADLGLSALIREKMGQESKVVQDPSVRIGGFTLTHQGKRLFYDGTLDARFLQSKSWFYENSSLEAV